MFHGCHTEESRLLYILRMLQTGDSLDILYFEMGDEKSDEYYEK
jgi:hypothetical protein